MIDSIESCRHAECAECGRILNRNSSDCYYSEITGEFYDTECYDEIGEEADND